MTTTGTVQGLIYDVVGVNVIPSASSMIKFTPVPEYITNTNDNEITILNPVLVTIDTNGYFSVDLIATDDPECSPINWTYTVEIFLPQRVVDPFSIQVEAGQTLDIADAVPVQSSPGTITIQGQGQIDHGSLTGLSDDDHPQYSQKAANLSDLTSTSTARTNLGIAFGASAGTYTEGNDSRIVGAAQKSANLSDLTSAATARTNLGLGTAATLNANNFMTKAGFAGDNVTDDGPAFQAAIDAGLPIFLDPGKTYLIDSAVFSDTNSAFKQVIIFGNGATIRLGPNLPTTNWTTDTTTKWAFFPNTLRTAKVGSVVTVNDANRATGSGSGALCSLVVFNVTIDAGAANRGFAFLNRTGALFDTVHFYRGRAAVTWWDYSDRAATFRNCYSRGGSGPAEQVLADGYQQGDGLIFENCKADSSVGLARLKTCRGALFSGTVTGKIEVTNCSGVVITAGHQEGQQSTMTTLAATNSVVSFYGTIIYENWSSTVCPITITDTTDESDSDIFLSNCQVVQLHTTSTGTTAFSPLIEVVSSGPNTKVRAKNLKGMFASSAMAGKHMDGIQPTIKGPTAIQTAVDSPEGRYALATGSWILRRKTSTTWALQAEGPKDFKFSTRETNTPSITQITTSSGVNAGGSLLNGTTYQYTIAVLDIFGNFSQYATAVSATPNSNGAVRIKISLNNAPSVVIVWRDAGTAVTTAPDYYCIVPISAAEPYLYDTGGFLMGRPWVAAQPSDAPATVAATNGTVDGIGFGGGILFTDSQGLKWKSPSNTTTLIAPV